MDCLYSLKCISCNLVDPSAWRSLFCTQSLHSIYSYLRSRVDVFPSLLSLCYIYTHTRHIFASFISRRVSLFMFVSDQRQDSLYYLKMMGFRMWWKMAHMLFVTLWKKKIKGVYATLQFKAIIGQGQPGLIWWILLWTMPLVQDRSFVLLTSSPARYHCITDLCHSFLTLRTFMFIHILMFSRLLLWGLWWAMVQPIAPVTQYGCR